MATLAVSDLYPAGAVLFESEESYLNELTDRETELSGGLVYPSVFCTITVDTTVLTRPLTIPIRPTLPQPTPPIILPL